MFRALGTWAGLIASTATASPVYLTCKIDQKTTEATADLVLDEASQTATISLPATGLVSKRRAVFSPDLVRIMDAPVIWEISRVSLALTHTFEIGDHRSVNHGKCALKPQPDKRAF